VTLLAFLLVGKQRWEDDVFVLNQGSVGAQSIFRMRHSGLELILAPVRTVNFPYDGVHAVTIVVVTKLAIGDWRLIQRIVAEGSEAREDMRLI
jgi:hypothetical protein